MCVDEMYDKRPSFEILMCSPRLILLSICLEFPRRWIPTAMSTASLCMMWLPLLLRKPCGAFVEADPKQLRCVTCHNMRPVALFVRCVHIETQTITPQALKRAVYITCRHCSVQKGKGIPKRFKKCNGCSTKAITYAAPHTSMCNKTVLQPITLK